MWFLHRLCLICRLSGKCLGILQGLSAAQGTRFHSEFERLGEFIRDYVLSGKLSQMYESELQNSRPS